MNNWLIYLVNLQIHLMLIKLPVLILMLEELTSASLIPSVALSLTSSIIPYSNVIFISILILYNLI